MNAITDREQKLVKGRQRTFRKIRLSANSRKHREKKGNRAKEVAKKKKAAHQKELDKLPLEYTVADVGRDCAAGLCSRQLCMERSKLRAPELSFELQHKWKETRTSYCKPKNFRKIHLLAPYSSHRANAHRGSEPLAREAGRALQGTHQV